MSVRRSLGFYGAPGGVEIEALRGVLLHVVLLHDDHVLDPGQRPHAVLESLFRDHDARLGIIHLVLDLLAV